MNKLRFVACWNVILLLLLSFSLAQEKAEPDKAKEGESRNQPKAVFKELTYDFGEVKRGDRLSHTFIVKNEGKGNLLISNVTPG